MKKKLLSGLICSALSACLLLCTGMTAAAASGTNDGDSFLTVEELTKGDSEDGTCSFYAGDRWEEDGDFFAGFTAENDSDQAVFLNRDEEEISGSLNGQPVQIYLAFDIETNEGYARISAADADAAGVASPDDISEVVFPCECQIGNVIFGTSAIIVDVRTYPDVTIAYSGGKSGSTASGGPGRTSQSTASGTSSQSTSSQSTSSQSAASEGRSGSGSNSSGGRTASSAGNILPSSVEVDEDGNWSFERGHEGDHSLYSPLMLSGTWEMEVTSFDIYEDPSLEYPSDTTDRIVRGLTDRSWEDTEYCVFPDEFRIGYIAGSSGMPVDLGGLYGGTFSYAYRDDEGNFSNSRSFSTFCDIDGDVLAVGLTAFDEYAFRNGDAAGSYEVREMDYRMEWSGYELKLSYGGETVTYRSKHLYFDDAGSLSMNSYQLAEGSEIFANIFGVGSSTVRFTTLGLDERGRVNYIYAKPQFRPDGTAVIEIPDGSDGYSTDNSGTTELQGNDLYLDLRSGDRILVNSEGNRYEFEKYYMSSFALTLVRDGKYYYFWASGYEDYDVFPYADPAATASAEPDVQLPEIFIQPNNILPDKVEKDVEGNWVYQNPEAAGDHSVFTPEMFYGTWELEGGTYNEDMQYYLTSEKTTKLGYAMSRSRTNLEYCIFPSSFRLGYALYGSDDMERQFGGLVLGKFSYISPDDADFPQDFAAVYDVSGSTLAVGFTNIDPDYYYNSSETEMDSFLVGELDYEIEWNGVELILTRDGESMYYVPRSINYLLANDDAKFSFDNNMYLGAGQEPQGTIYGVRHNGGLVLSTLGGLDKDGRYQYVDANYRLSNEEGNTSFEIPEDIYVYGDWGTAGTKMYGGKLYAEMRDGTRILLNPEGNRYVYDHYYYSGDVLTLVSGRDRWSYFSQNYADKGFPFAEIPEDDYVVEAPASESFDGSAFALNGVTNDRNVNSALNTMVDAGFTAKTDMQEQMASREVSESFMIEKDGVEIEVKTVNPFAKSIAKDSSVICYMKVTDTTGAITLGQGLSCGRSSKSDVMAQFTKPVKETEDMLIYKTQTGNQDSLAGFDYGDRLLYDNNVYIMMKFGGGVMESFEVVNNEYTYNDLEDNVDSNRRLSEYTPDILENVQKTRNQILTELTYAFLANDIDADIDAATGKIYLGSNILFGFNESHLEDAGKAYLDSFLAVYADTILHGDYRDDISEIRFDGYTDTVGSYEYNLTLSQKRADTVMNYCIGDNNSGMTASDRSDLAAVVTSVGHSYEDPVYDLNGEINMDASRRVEIKFFVKIQE